MYSKLIWLKGILARASPTQRNRGGGEEGRGWDAGRERGETFIWLENITSTFAWRDGDAAVRFDWHIRDLVIDNGKAASLKPNGVSNFLGSKYDWVKETWGGANSSKKNTYRLSIVTVKFGKSLSRKAQRESKIRWNTHKKTDKTADGLQEQKHLGVKLRWKQNNTKKKKIRASYNTAMSRSATGRRT